MRKLIYSMSVSLDGFTAGPDGEIDWSAPDEELHRFHNQRVQALGAHLLGRRLYEEMLFWETREEQPSAAEHELEFARIWKQLPKVVFSNTLDSVEPLKLLRGPLKGPGGPARISVRRSERHIGPRIGSTRDARI